VYLFWIITKIAFYPALWVGSLIFPHSILLSFLGYRESSYPVLVKRDSIYIQYMDCKASHTRGLCGNCFPISLILIAVSIFPVHNSYFAVKRCVFQLCCLFSFLGIDLLLLPRAVVLNFFIGCHFFLDVFCVILTCIIRSVVKILFTILTPFFDAAVCSAVSSTSHMYFIS